MSNVALRPRTHHHHGGPSPGPDIQRQDYRNGERRRRRRCGTSNELTELPFGSDKPFLHEGKWINRLVGGWSLLGFHTLQSGPPISVGGPDLWRIAGASPSRVSVVPGVQASLPYDVSLANARAYDPACGCTKPWAQFLRNWDVSARKRIAITEHVSFALEAQAYNVLNQVTFGTPSVTTVNSNNFGSVNGLSGAQGPRALEVGGRITF